VAVAAACVSSGARSSADRRILAKSQSSSASGFSMASSVEDLFLVAACNSADSDGAVACDVAGGISASAGGCDCVAVAAAAAARATEPGGRRFMGSCGTHAVPSRKHRLHGSGQHASRSHLTFELRQATHVCFITFACGSQSRPIRTQRGHGRSSSLHTVRALWQLAHACAFARSPLGGSVPPSPPSALGLDGAAPRRVARLAFESRGRWHGWWRGSVRPHAIRGRAPAQLQLIQ